MEKEYIASTHNIFVPETTEWDWKCCTLESKPLVDNQFISVEYGNILETGNILKHTADDPELTFPSFVLPLKIEFDL